MSEEKETEPGEVSIEYGRGVEAPKVAETFYARFDASPMAWAPGEDGLPSPQNITIEGSVPLSLGTLICMEDRSSFVLRSRFSGMGLASFAPSEVEQLPNGSHRAAASLALRRLAASRSVEALSLAALLARDVLLSGGYVRVEPVRPRCVHFARQTVDFPEENNHQVVERLCMKRATDTGVPLSLMDSAMYACDLRSPRDLASERRADAIDEAIIERGEERRAEGKFNVDAALDQQAKGLDVQFAVSGGIFNKG